MKESLVFYSEYDEPAAWTEALAAHLPDLDIRVYPDVGAPEAVRYALVWKPPQGFLARFPGLRLVVNLGAGVDALLARDDLPDVPITRISDPNMARMMAGYVLFAVLRYARDIPLFERAKRERRWAYVHPREACETRVGVLGLGELGATAAAELVRHGFDVRGWSRSPKSLAGVSCVHGKDALPRFLSELDIAVVMLPLTPETRRLLGRDMLSALPAGAKLINVSRGAVVDEQALLEALKSGHIAEATLDVFETEPLPPEHPFWTMENVLITPHLASVALPRSAAQQIAENIRRVRSGREVLNRVDPRRGY
ncbi:MAG: glyoxylate/hydroxypyruvate reductase A [Variibacter sp.]|nr:glyoxylate/hydroxypyruvate reductase A [Variibacter sp.]